MASIETTDRDSGYICSPSSGKEDAGRIPTETTATSSTNSTLLVAGFYILVLVAMSTISHYYNPTNTNLYVEQESRLLALEEDEHDRQVDVKKHTATIGILVNVYIAIAALSILCNLLLAFLISRKKESHDESQPRIYQRIMCCLAVTATVIEV